MFKVCARHGEEVIELEEFEQKPEAEEFKLHKYLYSIDDDGEEEYIYPYEMFIVEDNPGNVGKNIDLDDLPV